MLDFYHASYPEGVREKSYTLQMIERGESVLIAWSQDHSPTRFLQIYDITRTWLRAHFPGLDQDDTDIQSWLDRNA